MKLSLNNFLYDIKQIITGKTGAYSTISPGGTASAADGGIKVDRYLPLEAISASSIDAGLATTVLSIPVPALSALANSQVLNVLPGFNGKILAINFHVGASPATTSGKAATLTGQVATVATTGGIVSLTSADATPAGALVSGTAITGTNTFTKTQAIGVTVSAVTTFSEGGGTIEMTVQNTDLLSALDLSTINTGTTPVFTVPAAATTFGIVSFPIPRDYDEATDTLALRLFISLQNADAGITLTGTPTVIPLGQTAVTGTAVSAILPFKTAAVALSTTEQCVEINLSGLSLKRDGLIAIALALAGTTTGNTYISGLERTYASTIVSYNDTDTTGLDGSLSGYGNPLR